MYESKLNRISRLEERRAISDQKIYCGCRCHWKTIADYGIISDEKAERIWKIIESFGGFQKPDGTVRTFADDLKERIANRPSCTCSCIH